MGIKPPIHAINVAGKIAADQKEIETLQEALQAAPLWMPAAALLKECREASRIISGLIDWFESKLVIAIIGPSGSGKSTLLNALAGVDALSKTGSDRPTTQQIVVACCEEADAERLLDQFNKEDITIRKVSAAQGLEHMVLIDTPDADSTQNEKQIPLIHKVIESADVLICVFDAENPKRKDHTDFMAPYVKRFHGDSLIVTVNKCDRLEENELMEGIMPEFSDYIQKAWEHPVKAILCTSGRSHLKQPGWDNDAAPRNRLDQFDVLYEMILSTFNQDDFRINQRRKNALEIKTYLFNQVQTHALQDQKALKRISDSISKSETDAMQQALETVKQGHSAHVTGITVRLYQELGQRWMGPVGWLIAIWSRFLIFGSAFASLFRFGNPIRQVWGLISSYRHHQKTKDIVTAVERGEGVDSAVRAYHRFILQKWTDIAEDLIQSRFNPSVRRMNPLMPDPEDLEQNVSGIWQEALGREISKTAKTLSHMVIQVLLNLPVIAILVYTGWLTVTNFIKNSLLPSDFFLHATFTIAIFLFLSFFAFQLGVRLFGSGSRIIDRTFAMVRNLTTSGQHLTKSDIQNQIDTVLSLGVENPDLEK